MHNAYRLFFGPGFDQAPEHLAYDHGFFFQTIEHFLNDIKCFEPKIKGQG
jgi:hypothetical protein